MGGHHVDDVAERRRRRHRSAGEGGEEVTEQPRPAEAAAADDHAVAAGGAHHRQGVSGDPDVTVAEHGDRRDVGLELADGIPAGIAGVVLLGGAGMQGDVGDALVRAHGAGPQMGEQVVVQAHAELGGHRHAIRRQPS